MQYGEKMGGHFPGDAKLPRGEKEDPGGLANIFLFCGLKGRGESM